MPLPDTRFHCQTTDSAARQQTPLLDNKQISLPEQIPQLMMLPDD